MADNDRTTSSELDLLARDLEDRAGTQPDASLRRDPGTPALLRRIRTALSGVQAAIDDRRVLAFAVQDPENLITHAGRSTKSTGLWLNTTGRSFQITRVLGISDTDNYTFALYKSASASDIGTAGDTLLVTVPCSTNGSAMFSADLTAFSADTIEDGKWLILEHVSGTAGSITVQVEGNFV